MIGHFIFDDIDSRDYEGIVVVEAKVDSSPARVYESISVPGRNGDLLIDSKRYENEPHAYDIIVHKDYVDNLISLRNALMSKIGYKELTDSYNPDEKYMAYVRDAIDPKQGTWRRNGGTFRLVFERKPQRFLLSGEQVQTYTSSGTLNNPTLHDAKPLLAVTGGGNLTLGSQVMTIIERPSASSVLYIDCDSQEAWIEEGGAKLSRNDYVQNAGQQFPVLKAGSNTVNLGSGITRLEITPRWWRI